MSLRLLIPTFQVLNSSFQVLGSMPWITSTSIKFQLPGSGWKVFNRWQLLKPPSPPQPSSSGCWTPQPGDDYDVNVVHEREPGDSGDDVGRVAKTCQSCQSIGASFSRLVLFFLLSTRETLELEAPVLVAPVLVAPVLDAICYQL